jgi:hypothetical protein
MLREKKRDLCRVMAKGEKESLRSEKGGEYTYLASGLEQSATYA